MMYISEEVKNQYLNLIEGLDHECGLSRAIVETRYSDDLFYRHENEDGEKDMDQYLSNHNAWSAYGATRIVFGYDDDEYIIKIQTNLDNDDFDYGAREVETYEAAVEAKLDKYFAGCALLFHYTFTWGSRSFRLPVYIMKRCNCSYDQISDDSYNYHYSKYCEESGRDGNEDETRDLFYDEYEENYDSTDGMLMYAMTTWNEDYEDWAPLYRFISDWQINDLHAGNWGYVDGRLVLTDYAGYGQLADR